MKAIESYVEKTPELVPEDLAQHKSAVVNQLLDAPENLQGQATRYREPIVDHAGFDRRERLGEAVVA